jgi:hypothetical protein
MFHVKHFCPIGAKNLTRPHTSFRLRRVGLRGKAVMLVAGRLVTKLAVCCYRGYAFNERRNVERPARPRVLLSRRIRRCRRTYSGRGDRTILADPAERRSEKLNLIF